MDVDASLLNTAVCGEVSPAEPSVAPPDDANAASSDSPPGEPATGPCGAPTGSSSGSGSTASDGDNAEKRAQFDAFAADLVSYTQAPSAAAAWSFLEPSALHRIEMPPIEFVQSLEETYGADLLVQIGLYERDGDELRLPGWLANDAALSLRIDKENRRLQFLSDQEFLFSMARGVVDYALEKIPPGSDETPQTLFVVASRDDLDIMQRLGLKAITSEGFEAVRGADIQRLFDPEGERAWRYHLLLVDFAVADFRNQPTESVGAVIERLADAADVYAIDPTRRCGVCRPSDREFRNLQQAARFQDAGRIRQQFYDWAAAKRIRVEDWKHLKPSVLSFADASAALERALQQPDRSLRRSEVRRALVAYRAVGTAATIERLHRAIDRANEPLERFDLIAAASYAESFLDADPRLRAAEAVIAGREPPSMRDLHEQVFPLRQQCMAELRRIRREMKT